MQKHNQHKRGLGHDCDISVNGKAPDPYLHQSKATDGKQKNKEKSECRRIQNRSWHDVNKNVREQNPCPEQDDDLFWVFR